MEKFLAHCGISDVRKFTDTAEFFNQDGMDAVMVCTPDFTHLEVASSAMKAGKHVYLEKPLEVTAERCREILRVRNATGMVAYVGFNLRACQARSKAKELLSEGVLGKILHIEGLEQLRQAHGASFMRRFHRKHSQSGGLLNTKCSHDLDILQWLIGHDKRIVKVASFGGVSVFKPGGAPAERCSECPETVRNECPYRDTAGFVFPVGGEEPIHKTVDLETYGGDLCVYASGHELIDNQTAIFEWDDGTRGNFNLQLFQRDGKREMKIWGEKGLMTIGVDGVALRIIHSSGEKVDYDFPSRPGGHGGTDPSMLGRFLKAVRTGDAGDSGLEAGLAATLVAEKANEAMVESRVVELSPDEYCV
jgi:predicted dehydrogenase